MSTTGALAGTTHGHLFRARVPADRPPTDYTPRLIPASPFASVPLELPLVTWHH